VNEAAIRLIDELGANLRRPYRMLAYGDPNVDLLFAVDAVPGSGHKTLGRRLGRFAGGTVANAGCAAGAMGCRIQAFGRVGDDHDAHFLLQAYARHGVDTSHVRAVPDADSACAMVMLEANGEKALVYAPLAGTPFDASTLDAALRESALLYAMPYDIAEYAEVHALARAAGTLLAIDVEPAMVPLSGDIERLLRLADIVFMNELTYLSVFGRAPEPAHMRGLLALGPQVLAVTRGAAGALAISRHGAAQQGVFPVTPIDCTGAGDCFNGAFLAALFEGHDLDAALRFACAAASFAVARLGAREGIPTRVQVDELVTRSG
jgi:sugar/nucleoside kinase (ribokinase family)